MGAICTSKCTRNESLLLPSSLSRLCADVSYLSSIITCSVPARNCTCAHLHGNSLAVLVHAHAKFSREVVAVGILVGVNRARRQTRQGSYVTVLHGGEGLGGFAVVHTFCHL